jgi:hypothetical protein
MKKRNPGWGVNQKGRSKSKGQFIPIPYPMARSDAWRTLSGAAVKVWVELRVRYHGGNNGDLSLSLDEAARLLHIGKNTAQRAFRELEQKGFLKLVERGQWYGRKATRWSVTDRGVNGNPPTNEWKGWRNG